jgi:hypothetical protein
VSRLTEQELSDINAVATAIDEYANSVDDVRKLLAHIEALEAENAGLYEHLHGVHHCNCDLTALSGGGQHG